ncbi:MAG: outer membrane lipoprotein carrier protein LolA [Pseudomonadota bacterium]|nr:outer membrane lipoprotein carrier protein LolA [Pseudomonadota bacterium]
MLRTWLCVALCATALECRAADFEVGKLMELLRSQLPQRATFHETKEIAILDRSIESTGELNFTPPDRLEKRTIRPRAETMVVQGDLLTIERAGRQQTLTLSQHPEIAGLIDSIRATLAGDYASLQKSYVMSVEGDPQKWRLALRPKQDALAKIVARIQIDGTQSRVRRVEIEQADGDRSVMVMSPAAP